MSTNLTYLKSSKSGFFKYRRRTPKQLKEYISTNEVIKSLGTNETLATTKAIKLNNLLNEAIELTKIQSIPKETIKELLNQELDLESKQKAIVQKTKVSYFSKMYLEQSSITPKEYKYRDYFFNRFFPLVLEVLFKDADLEINELTFDKLLKVRNLLSKLPNMNYTSYKMMDKKELLEQVHKGTLKVPSQHLLSEDTVNKNLKRIKSLLLFAKELDKYNHNIPKTLIIQRKGETSSRNEKATLTDKDLKSVFAYEGDDLKYIYEVSYYTGMRRSELYKCDVVEIDGIVCFDLTNSPERLKTSSSYRVIPVHDKLLYKIHEFKEIMGRTKNHWITLCFSRLIKRELEDPTNKSLYSLRHTFATNLIAEGVQPEIVSELMGHAHNTMTMNRYVKGYPVKTLKEAIDCL